MTEFNTRIEKFRTPEGRIVERRTVVNPDGSLGEVSGAREVAARTDAEIYAAGIVRISPSSDDEAAA